MRIDSGTGLVLLSLVAAAAVGCSSSSDNGTGPGGDSGCSVTISGSVSASGACDQLGAEAAYDPATGTDFAVDAPDLAGGYTTTSDILIQAPLAANTTYTGGGNILSAGIDLTRASDNATWLATSNNDPAQNVGTISLAVTSVTTTSTINGVAAYAVHGTLTATLPAQAGSGATGSVTVKFTF